MPWVTRTEQVWVSEVEMNRARSGWLSAAEACRRLGDISRSRLNALALSGVVGHENVLGRSWYDAEDVEELARGGCPSDRHKAEAARAVAEWDMALPGGGVTRQAERPADLGIDPLAAFVARHAPEKR